MKRTLRAKIVLKNTSRYELRLFEKFLSNPQFPQHRILILSAFPELKTLINDMGDEKEAVKLFKKRFYVRYRKEINDASKKTAIIFKKQKGALKAAGEATEYVWEKPAVYIAVPTILPFSPFDKNTFYFSILNPVFGGRYFNPLVTAIHEISHFLFFDQLREIEKKERFCLHRDALYYLKETLTAALFNEPPLVSVLGTVNYSGNPEIRDISVKRKGKKSELFLAYIRREYRNRRSFESFLLKLVHFCHAAEKDFSKKRKLWNKFGKNIYEKKTALRKYKEPILFV